MDVDYVSFDDPLERDFATVDPVGFLDRFAKWPVILDEIQYVPALLSHVKMRIDAAPRRCGNWLLTGSQQFGLMRDVRQIRNIPDLRSFNQFLNLAASRHGQEFHVADLARELGISQPTVKSWAGVLEASYIAHFLQPWFRNYGKRVVKSPKFYFHDSALVSLLTRQPDAAAALAGPLGGPLLEGWVVTETVKAFMALGRKPDAYYWRSHDGLEVDLLIVIDGKLQPVEVKPTATPGAGHVEPLNRFLAVAGDEAGGSGIIVCRTDKQRAMPNGHLAMPWKSFPGWLQSKLEKLEQA